MGTLSNTAPPLPPADVFSSSTHTQGTYQERPKLPFVPGSECSGVIIEVGRDVRGLQPGDAVAALTPGGGAFAAEAIAPAIGVVRLPPGCDLEAAAGLPVTFGTAWMGLNDRARVQPGQVVLVLGAAGGVGLAAVQLAKALGARVIAVARGQSKIDALKSAGADVCIDLAQHKADEVRRLVRSAAPLGVDVLFDPVGGVLATEAFKTMRWGGHIIIVGFASGKPPALPANIALVKNLTIHGLYWGAHMQHDPKAFRASLDAVARLFAAGDIAVNVSHRYSLEQAPEAFSVLLKRGVIGKMVLLPAPRSML